MSRYLSWTDGERWSRLLERSGLTAPGATPIEPPGPGVPRGQQAGLVPSPPSGIERPADGRGPEFRGNLDQRLQQLLFWIGRQTGAEVLFVADDGGLPLLSVGPASELVTASAVLSAAYAKLWPPEGERRPSFTCLLFEGSRTLTVTEVLTPWGRFALGFLRDGFTDPSSLRRIRRELGRAFNEKGEIDG